MQAGVDGSCKRRLIVVACFFDLISKIGFSRTHSACATSSVHQKVNTKYRETFADRVYAALRVLPAGSVTTYGQLAKIAGSPGAARAVGNILHNNPDPIYTPCFRVVNSAGRLAQNFGFGGIKQQRKMLMVDGILVKNYTVDLSKYQITDEEWEQLIKQDIAEV